MGPQAGLPIFTRPRARLNRALCTALCLSLLACTTQAPKQDTLPARTFASIALVSPTDIVRVDAPETKSERVLKGASAGGAGTGLAGVLVGAAACGPYLYGLCVIGLGTAGMLAGGVAGALYGFTGIGEDEANKLESRVTRINARENLQSLLVGDITSRVPAAMLASPETAAVQAVLTLEKVEFSGDHSDVYIETHVRLTFAATDSQRKPEYGSRLYYSQKHKGRLKAWLDADSPALQEAIRACMEDIAVEIETVLREHWDSRGAGESPGETAFRLPDVAADRDEMADGTHQHEKMPDTVGVIQLAGLVQHVEHDAGGIGKPAGHEPVESGFR